jgi:hypothetical protein
VARYRIHLRVEREQGKRHAETKVTWSCTRLPSTHVAGGIVPIHQGERRQPEDTGELFGVYEAMKHAEPNGETLGYDDIEVVYQGLTHIFKRGKIDRSTTGPNFTRGVSRATFHEVNARKRPLGSDI